MRVCVCVCLYVWDLIMTSRADAAAADLFNQSVWPLSFQCCLTYRVRTTWKNEGNRRTYPKVPITIITIIMIIIRVRSRFPVHNNQSKFSSQLSLEVLHSFSLCSPSHTQAHTCDISKTPLIKVAHSFSRFFFIDMHPSMYVHVYETKIPLVSMLWYLHMEACASFMT